MSQSLDDGYSMGGEEIHPPTSTPLSMHCFPNEILIDIFELCIAITYQATRRRRETDICTTRWSLLNNLMLVCRHWREVISGTSLLWCVIDIAQPVRSLPLCLDRTAGLPLHIVRTPGKWDGIEDENLRTLTPHASRVHSIDIDSNGTWGRVPKTVFQFILNSDMSSLESLWLRQSFGPFSVDQQRFPRLRSLYMWYTRGLSGLASHTRLRTLSLVNLQWELSMIDLLEVIRQNVELEDIALSMVLPDLVKPSPQDIWPSPCPLPRLKHMKLLETFDTISQFLSFLLLPPSATVWLQASPSYSPTALLQSPHVLLSMLPPDFPSFIPSIAQSTHVWLEVTSRSPSSYHLQNYEATGTPRDAGDLKISFPNLVPRMQDAASIMHGICDLIHIFGSAPITHLDVHAEGTDASARAWEAVFHAFPALESLAVRGSVWTVRELWKALRSVRVSLNDGGREGEEMDSGVGRRSKASSRLRIIRIHLELELSDTAGFFTAGLLEGMVACLWDRAARGVCLEKLVLGYGIAWFAMPESALTDLKALIGEGVGIVECFDC